MLQHERARLGKQAMNKATDELRRLRVRAAGRRLACRACGRSRRRAAAAMPVLPRAAWARRRAYAPSCWSKLSLIEKPYCARLGIPFLYDPGPGLLSMEAMANPPAYDRARAAVRYDEVARTLVMAFKYADRLDLAPDDGRLDGARRARTHWPRPTR